MQGKVTRQGPVTHVVKRHGYQPAVIYAHGQDEATRIKRALWAAVPASVIRPGGAIKVTVSAIKPKRSKKG